MQRLGAVLCGAWLIGATANVAAAQASLVGYVRDEATLRPLAGAEVSAQGVEKRTRTDKEGRYQLNDLPAGVVHLIVRLPGYAAADTLLEFQPGKNENVFYLGKGVIALDTVKTKAPERLASVGLAGFAERKAKGFGAFFDSTYLRANEQQHLADVLRNVRGIDVMTPTTCKLAHPVFCDWRVAAKGSPTQGVCLAEVIVDGTVFQHSLKFDDRDAPPFSPRAVIQAYADNKMRMWQPAFDLNRMSISNLAAVEVYRSGAEAPILFGGDDTNCGIVVLWTRR